MTRLRPGPRHRRAHRIGGWLPLEPVIIRDYVNERILPEVDEEQEWIPEVKELDKLIHSDKVLRMLFEAMLKEVPKGHPFDEDPSLQPEIRNIKTLLSAINFQVQKPIKYNDSVQIGTPLNAILSWPMATESGYAAFLREDVNLCISKILSVWGSYLRDPTRDSISTVTTRHGGWLSPSSQNDPSSPGLRNFLSIYLVPNPSDPLHYGFQTWDQFFTRRFLPGLRPIASPENPFVLASATESTPFAIQRNVQLRDAFWAKDQHYSLEDMLGDREMAAKFAGGTVYQAFLSADCYHNWHAPVDGRFLAEPKVLAGTYYSEPVIWGFPHPDPGSDARSQGYISCMAKRAVGYILPEKRELGIIAMVMIGMAEVSSVEFDREACEKGFRKGEEIGRFHYGGSTHCLVFQPGVKFTPAHNAVPLGVNSDQSPVKVCSELGTLSVSR